MILLKNQHHSLLLCHIYLCKAKSSSKVKREHDPELQNELKKCVTHVILLRIQQEDLTKDKARGSSIYKQGTDDTDRHSWEGGEGETINR